MDEIDNSEMMVNPDEDQTDDFDELIMMANEEGDEDDEQYGTGERIGETDKNLIMERFMLDDEGKSVWKHSDFRRDSDDDDMNVDFEGKWQIF